VSLSDLKYSKLKSYFGSSASSTVTDLEYKYWNTRPNNLRLEDYNASAGTGDASVDTAARNALMAAAQPGDRIYMPPDKVYRFNSRWTIDKADLWIGGGGTYQALNPADSSLYVVPAGHGLSVDGLLIDCTVNLPDRTKVSQATSSAARLSTAESTGFMSQANNITLNRVTVRGSAGAAFWNTGGAYNTWTDCTADRNLADGFHHSGPNCIKGKLIRPKAINTGDDGVSFVYYIEEAAAVGNHDYEVHDAVIISSYARGAAIAGGKNIRFYNTHVYHSRAAALTIENQNGWKTHPTNGAYYLGGRIVGSNWDHSVWQGVVHVEATDSGGRTITNGAASDFELIDALPRDKTSDGSMDGPGGGVAVAVVIGSNPVSGLRFDRWTTRGIIPTPFVHYSVRLNEYSGGGTPVASANDWQINGVVSASVI
jgi:hypothetical protein